MATHCSIGFSQELDPVIAAKNAAQQARQGLDENRIDLAIVYNTMHYSPSVFLPVVYDALEHTRVVGCSTAGIILADRVETQGIAILLLYSDNIKFETEEEDRLDIQDPFLAGQQLASKCFTDFAKRHRKFFFLLFDGMQEHTSRLMDGIQSKLPSGFPVAGAGSSNNFSSLPAFQYFQDKITYKGATGILLGGNPSFALSSRHGWHPLGKPRKITAAQENKIIEIDHRPAAEFLKEFYQESFPELNQSPWNPLNVRYPLGFKTSETHDYSLRNIRQILDDGSIICQDNPGVNSEIHIMISNEEFCLEAAIEAATDIKAQIKNRPPYVALIFESASRYRFLGQHASSKEIAAITQSLGKDIPIFGMYSFGEILPGQDQDRGKKAFYRESSIMILALR